MEEKTQTKGEYLVGVSFNPGGHPEVDTIKKQSAQLIDFIYGIGNNTRCTSLAVKSIEEGAMWAVKSVTKKPRQ